MNDLQNFGNLTKHLPGDAPPWLQRLRKEGFSRFGESGFPTIKNEDWKNTDLAVLKEQTFYLPQASKQTKSQPLSSILDAQDINLVFINGYFSNSYSDLRALPKGLNILDFKTTTVHQRHRFSDFLRMNEHPDALTALNNAFLNEGVCLFIDDQITVQPLIHIIHLSDLTQDHGLLSPRTFISVGESSHVKVLESHIANDSTISLTNALTQIILERQARLCYVRAQKVNKQSLFLGNTKIVQKQDSLGESFCLMAGGQLARHNLDIVLDGAGTDSRLWGLYAADGSQHVDNHTSIEHRFTNGKSTQLYKGILDGSARGVFTGKILVKRDAQQTNAYQLNKNLLLGRDSRVDTTPQLQIFADDVKCSHGATIGQLNDEEIFYLRSRGIPKSRCVSMLAHGFIEDILNRISEGGIRTKLNTMLKETFQSIEQTSGVQA